MQRGRLVRSLVRLGQEAESFVVVLDAEREASPPVEVRHLVRVDLEGRRRPDPRLDEPLQRVRRGCQRVRRATSEGEDFPDAAPDEEAVQLAVQRLEGGHVRAEVDAEADREGEVPDDLLRAAPGPALDEPLALHDGLEGPVEIP